MQKVVLSRHNIYIFSHKFYGMAKKKTKAELAIAAAKKLEKLPSQEQQMREYKQDIKLGEKLKGLLKRTWFVRKKKKTSSRRK